MPDDDTIPKIQVDSDWKAQAQAEKERLIKIEKENEAAQAVNQSGGELPEASFRTLVGTLASQAIMGLGAMADPKTGRVIIDLESSQFSIDMLQVLEEKTKGNLTDEEKDEMTQVLSELRGRFVQVTQMIAKQAHAQGVADPAASNVKDSGPKIIMPD